MKKMTGYGYGNGGEALIKAIGKKMNASERNNTISMLQKMAKSGMEVDLVEMTNSMQPMAGTGMETYKYGGMKGMKKGKKKRK